MTQKELILPAIIAHRGASYFAPENTLSALDKAHELGATWVEFDVMLTRDGEVVVHHDSRVDRTTNGEGFIDELFFHQIKKLDAGSWFGPLFKGEKIPLFNEWLDRCAELKMGINIEMKAVGKKAAEALSKAVVLSLEKHWRDDLPHPLFSSFSIDCLKAMKKISNTFSLGFAVKHWPDELFDFLDALNCVSLHAHSNLLTSDRVASILSTGRQVLAFTVNDKKKAQSLFNKGVNAVFTDNPLLLQ